MPDNNQIYPSSAHKFFDINLPSFGKCDIEVRPHEDINISPRVYIVDQNDNDICSIELQKYRLEFFKTHTEADIDAICKFMASNFDDAFCGITACPVYNTLSALWLVFNGPEYECVKFPTENPYSNNKTRED